MSRVLVGEVELKVLSGEMSSIIGEFEFKVLAGEMGLMSRVIGEVGSEDVEAVGEVAADAAKEEGWELAKSNLTGELDEEVVVEVKLRSVLRGFLPLLLLLLLLLILVGKGQVVGGEVMEGPSESIHLIITKVKFKWWHAEDDKKNCNCANDLTC